MRKGSRVWLFVLVLIISSVPLASALGAKLLGQKITVYAHSVWSVVANQTVWVVDAWQMSIPSQHYWYH